ncbi:MAG: hypothetical protein AAF499_08995, partial [Pseudomonadota bacterium]
RVVTLHSGWLPRLNDVLAELSLVVAVQGDADAIVSLNGLAFLKTASRYDIAVLSPHQVAERDGYVG